MPVVFDLLRGEALVGHLGIPIEDAGTRGEIRAGGIVLRPVGFGERTRIVARAALTQQPVEGVIAGITQAASVASDVPDTQPGDDLPRSVIEVLALALAGADQDGPVFSEAAYELGRAGGWSFGDILEAPATEVDRLASSFVQAADGWHRIRFNIGHTDDEAEVAALRVEYATNLLRRLDSGDVVLPAREVTARSPRASEVASLPPRPTRSEDAVPARDSADASVDADAPYSDVHASGQSRLTPSTRAAAEPFSAELPRRWRLGRGMGVPAASDTGGTVDHAARLVEVAAGVAPLPSSVAERAARTHEEWPHTLVEAATSRRTEREPASTPLHREPVDGSGRERGAATGRRTELALGLIGAPAPLRVPAAPSAAAAAGFTATAGPDARGASAAPATVAEPAGTTASRARSRGEVIPSVDELADRIAWMLDAESDLRGVER